MSMTNNIGRMTDGPIPWMSMGPIADRPTTAELNSFYISTDEVAGKFKIYWWNGTAWTQFKGVDMT